jgi:phage terminase large subunit
MVTADGTIKASNVYERLQDAYDAHRYVAFVLEGGSRSSKTISIIQFLLLWAQEGHRINNELRANGLPIVEKRFLICRAVAAWLTGTVIEDFLKVLMAYGWYREKDWNKTARVYKLFDTRFVFVGLDDRQKLHGMTSDGFWINEAIEALQDDFDQLEQRASGPIILDYNPTEEEHWIYDAVLKRADVHYIHSTMLDNPFLPEQMRRKILSYEPTPFNIAQGTSNKSKWEMYGLGLRVKLEGLVFERGFDIVDEIPAYIPRNKRFTALDFGFTHDPTAISEIAIDVPGNTLYIDELCYRTHMLTGDIIAELKLVNSERWIIAESADPRLIAEISLAGFIITAVDKSDVSGQKGAESSIKAGLDKMKEMKIAITRRSINAVKEFKNYVYATDKTGKRLNVPVDDWNHVIDGVRYVVLMTLLGKMQKQQKLGNVLGALPG